MKKLILLALSLLAGNFANAQLALTPEGLMNAKDMSTITITIEDSGVSKEKLFEAYKNYAEEYSATKRGLTVFDNESDGFMIKFVHVGHFGTTAVKTGSASFVLLFKFEDGAAEIQVRNFKLSRIGLFKSESRQYIYSDKGKLTREGKILKPMVEREVNLHYNDIVGTVSSLIELQKK
jgi:hypothetical protein